MRDAIAGSTSAPPQRLRIHAPAKINLALRILAREDTGFHQIETLFVSLEEGDTVALSRTARGVALSTEGPAPCPTEENLAYRAAREFLERSGGEGGVEIRLVKRLPTRAGIGGGSSDAAATLRGLQRLFPGRLSTEQLLKLAGDLGSDVPFFLSPTPMALAWGRGDRLLPLSPLPAVPVVLAFPPLEMDTASAYRMIDRLRDGARREQVPRIVDPGSFSSWTQVAALARNDFEEVVLPARPILATLRDAMAKTSPLATLLAGSGATLFAVYPGRREAMDGKGALEAAFPRIRFVLTRTLERIPDPIPGEGVER